MNVEDHDKLFTNMIVYGIGLYIYQNINGKPVARVVDPKEYGELADALKYNMENRHD